MFLWNEAAGLGQTLFAGAPPGKIWERYIYMRGITSYRRGQREIDALIANLMALEEILDDIKQSGGISDAVLVSRSGMHIAGKVPSGAHAETFVAMSAILLGAAETSTSELKERLKIVTIMLERSKVSIGIVSPKAVLVMKSDLSESDEHLLEVISRAIPKFDKALK